MIKSAYKFLKDNRHKENFINYIYEKVNSNSPLDMNDISKNNFVSKSTITRFFKQNGYDGFREFKFLLHNEAVEMNNSPLVQQTTSQDHILNLLTNVLKTTKIKNDDKIYEKVIEAIKKSKSILICGIGGNIPLAIELKNKLNRFGFNAKAEIDHHQTYVLTKNLTADDLVIAISYTCNTPELIRSIESAAKKQAKIIGITKPYKSKLSQIASINLYADCDELITRFMSIESRIAMYYIILNLVMKIFASNEEYYKQKLFESLY